MITKILKSEEKFKDECICAYRVLNFINGIKTDVPWWFEIAYYDETEDTYHIIFKSYTTEEYKDYVLSIQAKKIDDQWTYRVIKKIDGLTPLK